MRDPRPWSLLLCIVLAGTAGCGDSAGGPAEAVVRFTPGACAVALPAGQSLDGVLCGTLTVPELRGTAFDGRTIDLPVVVLRATGSDPAPDPLVALSGGPGDSGLGRILPNWTARFAAELQTRRDLVFFDQRGTGSSRPRLGCPEYVAAVRDALGENLSPREEARRQVAALRACHDRLRAAGVRFAAYTSAASAADVRDLMRALGYRSWNLRGISYGARLALTALRDVPDGIRSVILDSPVPPQVAFDADIAANFARALDVVFAACARDAACAAVYPDLAGTLAALVAKLDAEPIVVPASAAGPRLVITGERLLLGLQQALYAADLVPLLPFGITSIAGGNTALLEQIASGQTDGLDAVAWGVRHAVGCAEEVPFETSAVIADALQDVAPRLAEFGRASVLEPTLGTCAFWDTAPLGAIENEPVHGDVPALLLSGEFDPVTPPAYGALIAGTLPNAHVVALPGYAHGVLPRRGPEGDRPACSMQIVARFLDDPAAPPDTRCIADIPSVRFVGS